MMIRLMTMETLSMVFIGGLFEAPQGNISANIAKREKK